MTVFALINSNSMTVTAHVNAPMEQLERKVNPKHVWWLFDSLPSSFAVLAVPCYTLTAVTQVGLATREQFARICVFYYQIWISERTVRLQICRVVRFHERIILIRNTHSVSVLLPLSAFVLEVFVQVLYTFPVLHHVKLFKWNVTFLD